jgi:hypothetical protein
MRSHRKHGSPPNDSQCGGDKAFGVEGVYQTGFEAKDIAGQVEGTDLPAAVPESLTGSHRAAG